MTDRPVAVVTGASSGIGAATARHLSDAGYDVVLGARRVDRLVEVAEPLRGRALALDVTDDDSVDAFCDAIDRCNVVVNNAGGALGLEPVGDFDAEKWRAMYETNVIGVARVTKALLPKLEASGDGHVVVVGSVAGLQAYPGGGGYNAAKFGVNAVTQVLRMELLGRPVRVTEVDPGMVETEFSLVRFDGDAERADAVYEGLTPLSADDVADCIRWAVTRPAHVNINRIEVMPSDQATATMAHRQR